MFNSPSSEERSESLEWCKCDDDAIDILLANFMCCRAAAASLLKGLGEHRSHKYSSGRLFLLSKTQSTCCQTLNNHLKHWLIIKINVTKCMIYKTNTHKHLSQLIINPSSCSISLKLKENNALNTHIHRYILLNT